MTEPTGGGGLLGAMGQKSDVMNLPKTPAAAAEQIKQNRQLMAKAATSYLNTSAVANFSLWPLHDKMSCFVRTPKSFIKSRRIGTTVVPYVESSYSQKVLNFIFNFQVSSEVTDTKLVEESVNGKKTYLGAATVKFTFFDERTGREIIRTVRSSHRAYQNNATTPDDSVKAAISKAWTVVARTFGLFHDIKEEKAIEQIEADVVSGEIKQPPSKDFDFN
jgi:hypothetical protein